MYRALFELIVTIFIIVVARSLLTSLLKGVSSAARTYQAPGQQQQQQANTPPPPNANELHKDPVCGTYVAESTPFQRRATGQVFYYCSTQCREKHAMAVR